MFLRIKFETFYAACLYFFNHLDVHESDPVLLLVHTISAELLQFRGYLTLYTVQKRTIDFILLDKIAFHTGLLC
jgi:hypothetical protein